MIFIEFNIAAGNPLIVTPGYVKGVLPHPKSQKTIYRTLAFLPSEAANTSSDASITHKYLVCASSYVKHHRFLSIEIFDVLRLVSRVRADVFPTVHTLHDLEHQRFLLIESRARFARSLTSKISFFRDLLRFTCALMRLSKCLPNCARFARSGSFFRYSTSAGYLLPTGYVLSLCCSGSVYVP